VLIPPLLTQEKGKEEELFRALYTEREEQEKELSEEELKELYLDMVVKAPTEKDIQIQDCDGLGEEGYRLEYTKSKRRKSIEALVLGWDEGTGTGMGGSSPLKGECGWDEGEIDSEKCQSWKPNSKSDSKEEDGEDVFEDVDLYTDANDGARGKGGEKESESEAEDVQMTEALRARSLFLRRFDFEGGETFGDEEGKGEIL